jgi:threonyl-tRNA synthetase
MLIVGEKEAAENHVSIRKHGAGDQGSKGVNEFIKLIQNEIDELLHIND